MVGAPDTAPGNSTPLTLHHLFNSAFFKGHKPEPRLPGVNVTTDPAVLPAAPCVLVHLPSILATSGAGALRSLRKVMPKSQLWIAECQESAAIYPELGDSDFMQLFDLEVSYRQSADVWHPYVDAGVIDKFRDTGFKTRRKLCCAFVSSNFDMSNRRQYMAALSEHVPIASYGQFMRNRHLFFDRGAATKMRILHRYAFTLAFENSIAEGYVTEKFFQPLMSGTVPIYLGAPNIEEFAPGDNCYIDASRFPDPQELADHMRKADPASFHEWRRKPLRKSFIEKIESLRTPPYVRLSREICRRLPLPERP